MLFEKSLDYKNAHCSLDYKKVEGKAFFFDVRGLDTVYLPNFHQGQKNTTMIFIAFNDHRLLELDSKNVDEFNWHK